MNMELDSNRDLDAPPWLLDESEVIELMGLFLTRLDNKPQAERQNPIQIKLSSSKQKKLFKNNADSDQTWSLLMSLDGVVFTIREDRKRGLYDPVYQGATIKLLAGEEDIAEAILRSWLNRPVSTPYRDQWISAVLERGHEFCGLSELFSQRPQKLVGKTPVELVEAFLSINSHLKAGLTLRQLSSKCFWGYSKYLDTREELVLLLFPGLVIRPRPVVVSVYLPEVVKEVLFIENQDTYVHAVGGRLQIAETTALVYAAGFRGAASRIRDDDGASVHIHGQSHMASKEVFLNWWFCNLTSGWRLWFWGDMDFSGFMILKSLRKVFDDVRAWPDGYTPMLDLLNRNLGHTSELSEKSSQIDPGITGCVLSDQVLLPALRSKKAFVDQEAVVV